jgi:hypothetical protein
MSVTVTLAAHTHRDKTSLWQCIAGMNQQHITMIDATLEVQWYPVCTKQDHKI